MRTLVTYTLLIFLSVVSAHAQGMKKLTQLQDFEKRLAEEAQTVQSIEIKSAWNISARWTISL